MGWWKTQHGTIGDAPADHLEEAFANIESQYLRDVGRLPTQGEMVDLIAFCTCGCLVSKCGDPNFAWTKATAHEDDTPRAEPRGSRGASGTCAAPPEGQLINIDPATGEHFNPPSVDTLGEEADPADDWKGGSGVN